MSIPTHPNPGPEFDDPLAALMRAWSSMVAVVPPIGTAPGAWLGSAQAISGVPGAQINIVLMQAHAAATGAMLRAWQRGAQSWADCRIAAGTPASAPAAGAEELARQVDAARAHVRRLAEIAGDEARLLEAQLRGVDEQLRALVPDTTPTPTARRYARAKR